MLQPTGMLRLSVSKVLFSSWRRRESTEGESSLYRRVLMPANFCWLICQNLADWSFTSFFVEYHRLMDKIKDESPAHILFPRRDCSSVNAAGGFKACIEFDLWEALSRCRGQTTCSKYLRELVNKSHIIGFKVTPVSLKIADADQAWSICFYAVSEKTKTLFIRTNACYSLKADEMTYKVHQNVTWACLRSNGVLVNWKGREERIRPFCYRLLFPLQFVNNHFLS